MNRFETVKWLRAASRCGSCLLFLFGLGFPVLAEETNMPRNPPSNRWLVIVQTTSSMAPRAPSAANLSAMLVATGMGGQMRDGDTLGLWTFDESLHTGVFPIQMWTPATRKAIADRVYDFVKAQKFEKEGHLSFVLSDAQKVIKNSDYITLVLITDGMEDLYGTPFDEKVNGVYRTWRRDEAKENIPFITALRAEHGRLTNCAVTVAPWPLEMPPPSSELEAIRNRLIQPPEPSVVTVTSAPVVLPPLIVSGKKHDDQSVPAPAPTSNPTHLDASASPAPSPEAQPAPPPAAVPVPAPAAENTGSSPTAIKPAPAEQAEIPPPSPQPTTSTPVVATVSNPPQPEPPSPAPAATAPVESRETISIADLLSRKNGWIIPLGIAGLVIVSFSLGAVFTLFRRVRSADRISLVSPPSEREKSGKKADY